MSPALYQLVVVVDPDLADLGVAVLFEADLGGVEERASEDGRTELVVYAPDRAALEALAAEVVDRIAGARAVVDLLADCDWQTEWMRHLEPQPIGDSFVIQPARDPSPAPPGRSVIRFEPRMAFGVGSHATTCLVAIAVERFCRDHPGCRVLDVGTGTGVLAMVALLSGASFVEATDSDPVAVAAATENLNLNGLVSRARISGRSLSEIEDRFDLVAANLESPALLELASSLAARVASGGRLVLSGVLDAQSETVNEALAAAGARLVARDTLEGWSRLEFVAGS